METKVISVKKPINNIVDAKQAIIEMQELARSIFKTAWEKGYHRELALFSMDLRDNFEKGDPGY